MKIGLVRRGYSSSGGAESYLLRLAAGLVQAGHELTLFTSPEWPESQWPHGSMVRIVGNSPMQFARNLEIVRRRKGEHNPYDVLFSFERILNCDVYRAGDGVHAAWLQRRQAFESRWKWISRAFNTKHRELLRLEACMYDPQHVRMVIANSQMVRNEIVQYYGFPAERIAVIPNGIDCPNPLPPAVSSQSSRPCTILFAGSGWERKGLSLALEAIARLPDVRLLVAGRGTWRRAIPPRVQFLGAVSDMPSLFAQADLFLLPTWYDPFSNACLEALAAGLPVITTSANGFSEIVTPGVTGEIVPSGTVQPMVHAIQSWQDPAKRDHARLACRALAAQYTISENVRKIGEVLKASLII